MQLSALFDRLLETLQRWLETAVAMLPHLVVAVLVLLLFGYASRYVGRLVTRLLQRVTHHQSLSGLFGTIARVATVIIGVAIALGLLQLDKTVTSLLAGVGVVGLALGFAFQDIAANFMSGFIMALRRPFEVGDLVEIGGQRGIVERLELRATLIHTLQGLSVIIPNKDVFQNPILNYTRTRDRRVDLEVGVAYDADLEMVRRVTLDAVRKLEHRDPARDPELYYTEFNDSAINFSLRIWLTSADEPTFLTARSEAIIAVKNTFDAHHIVIPFPIRTLDFGADEVGGTPLNRMKDRVKGRGGD